MPAVTDPAMLVLYGFDESGLSSTRVNSGSLGSTQDLSPYQSTGTDGIPPVDDSRGGKAVWLDVTYAAPWNGLTSAARALRAPVFTGSAHPCRPPLPIASAANDFALGARFYWTGETDGGGGAEAQTIFSLVATSGPTFAWAITVLPNTNANPATGGRIQLRVAGTSFELTGGSWTQTGSPPSQYVTPNLWYRVTVRIFFVSTGYRLKVYLYEESTGTTYTFLYNVADITTDWQGAFNSATDARLQVGVDAGSSNPVSLYGYVDEAWFFDNPMTDGEALTTVVGGFQVPWNEPNYRVADHDTRLTYAEARTDFPPPRELPVGGDAEHTVGVQCERFKVRYHSFRPGRPTAIRRINVQFDTIGKYNSKRGNLKKYDDLTMGLVRLPGALPTGACSDVRNFEFTGTGARRRRGFRVRRAVNDSVDFSFNSFFSWRDSSDVLYRCYKVGTALYAETGSSATSIDTGWSTLEQVVAQDLDNRLILCSPSRRKSWRGSNSAVESFGAPAAPTAPTAATTVGALTGAYYYAYTEYDPTTGDESAPGILASVISPSAQGVTLTLAAVSSDTRFSQRRIYRTTAGGAAPLLFRIATISTATSYTDSGAADGTVRVGSVVDTNNVLVEYITGTAPDTFVGCCVHLNRMFYWAGNKLYWTLEYEPFRWGANGSTGSMSLTADAPIRAVLSMGYRLIIFTTHTVEIIESDFVPDGSGLSQIRRSVVERTVGATGPHSPVIYNDQAYWADRRGIYTLIGDRVLKISKKIDNLFKWLNVGYAQKVVGAYNHIRGVIEWTCPFGSIQEDNTRFQTTIVLHPGEDPKWSIYEREASFVGQFDDDLNGIRFGAIDHLGVFKEMESYEGDGAEGNESTTTEDSDGISSISGSTVTVTPSPGWTTDEHRGKGVVLWDASTGAFYYYTIARNAAATFTVVGTPNSALAAGDGYYIGGMNAFLEIAEQDLDSLNNKRVSAMKTHFDELTAARFT